MAGHDIIVIGASAGGVGALTELVAGLPSDLPAAVFVVLHIPPGVPSLLPQILARSTNLPVSHPRDFESIESGHIYVAPPDHHLLVGDGCVQVTHGPRENRSRPAVDPLFRSAALNYGPRVTGVVLTGALDDGTAGLRAIKQRGGKAVVQDPADALYPSMPRSALAHVDVDYALPLNDIPPLLVQLALEPAEDERMHPVSDEIRIETAIAGDAASDADLVGKLGSPSVYSCPECNGVLWEVNDGSMLRFRCRVGHAYSAESMALEQSEALEAALWAAARSLEESAGLSRRLAARSREQNHLMVAQRYDHRAAENEHNALVLREVISREAGKPVEEAAQMNISQAKRRRSD